MKKLIPLILTAALTLAACASASDETPLTTPTPASEAPEPTSTPAPPTSTHWKATLRLSTPAMLTTSLSHIPVMPCC